VRISERKSGGKVAVQSLKGHQKTGKNISEGTKKNRRELFGHVKRIPVNRLPWKILNGEQGEGPEKYGWMELDWLNMK
jgi:hypothetical protein